jgi:homoserine O-succinyltransferase
MRRDVLTISNRMHAPAHHTVRFKMLDGSQKIEPAQGGSGEAFISGAPGRKSAGTILSIGLVNNMPDAAQARTELQFASLLDAAAGSQVKLRLHRLSIREVPRGEAAAAAMRDRYRDIDSIANLKLDALIVTGTEPRTRFLPDEPYWPRLTQLADWARDNVDSAIWSCLAAHAAVQYLDQIERRPTGAKRLGVFDCDVRTGHPLLSGLPANIQTPHSRYNELAEDELASAGYDILTRSAAAGADMFIKNHGRSLFVYFQGHPEYGPAMLWLEYRRDIIRFLTGERDEYPNAPLDYFSPANSCKLKTFESRAKALRSPSLVAELPEIGGQACQSFSWRTSAVLIYRNWLNQIMERKQTCDSFSFRRAGSR